VRFTNSDAIDIR